MEDAERKNPGGFPDDGVEYVQRAIPKGALPWVSGDEARIEFEDDGVIEELPELPDAEPVVEEKEEKPVAARSMRLPEPSAGIPEWMKVPRGLKFPRGRLPVYVRFRAELTDVPTRGERQAICWALTDADEMLAYKRSMGDPARAIDELTKQMVRAVDGHQVDWSGGATPGSIDRWWTEIGGRCRSILKRVYMQTHQATEAEVRDFFENCIAVGGTG